MRFWDTSALVPLLVTENRSAELREVLRSDADIVTSGITAVEIISALWRRRHAGLLDLDAHQRADALFAQISGRWTEVAHSSTVTTLAISALTRHPLRTLDALQLGAALLFSGSDARVPFVTIDRKLAAAVRAEGFPVLP